MRLRDLLKDKHGTAYIKTCVLLMIILMVFSVAFYFTLTVVQAKAQRKQTIQTLDMYTEQNAMSIYNSIKNQHDTSDFATLSGEDALDPAPFVALLCSAQGLQTSDGVYVSYSKDGQVRYKVSQVKMNYMINRTTKIRVEYTLIMPLQFLGNTIMVDIPVVISTSLMAKFDA